MDTIEKVYKIETNIGDNPYPNSAFTSREKCEGIITNLALEKYGKPTYEADSVEVTLVNDYWGGDISYDELKKHLDEKFNEVMQSALYYDFIDLYWIEEINIIY